MKGLVRLLYAAAALLCFCPAIYPESIRLPSETDWAAIEPSQWGKFQERHLLSYPGGSFQIEPETLLTGGVIKDIGNAFSFYLVSPDQLFLNLLRITSPAVSDETVVAVPMRYVVGQATGLFNEQVYQNDLDSLLLSPLDVLIPLLGGPLFFDSRSDPLARFTVAPGGLAPSQVSLVAIEAQRGTPETSLLDRIRGDGLPEKVLLVLLGIGLALLPAIFRRLKILSRLMAAAPAQVRAGLGLLHPPRYVPSEIKPTHDNKEVNLVRPRRQVVKRDESWRNHSPLVVARADSSPAVSDEEVSLSAGSALASSAEADVQRKMNNDSLTENYLVAGAAAQNAQVRQIEKPEGEEKPETVRNTTAEAPRQNMGINGNGSNLPGHHPEPSSPANPVSARPLAVSAPTMTQTLSQPSVAEKMQTPESCAETRQTPRQPHTAEQQIMNGSPDLTSRIVPTGRRAVTEDAGINERGVADKTMAFAHDPQHSFHDLRAGVILQWLESSAPAMLEAVAWEEEHLGEYRGLPFADIVADERQPRSVRHDYTEP